MAFSLDSILLLAGLVLLVGLNLVVLVTLVRGKAQHEDNLRALMDEDRAAHFELTAQCLREQKEDLLLSQRQSESALRHDVAGIAERVQAGQQTSQKALGDLAQENRLALSAMAEKAQSANVTMLSHTQSGLKTLMDQSLQTSTSLRDELNKALGDMRREMQTNIAQIRADNDKKLEAMRATVEEKLDKTLTDRLTQSFKTVDDKLALVQQGLGEMQAMARSVQDLKGVLTNVKTRGTFGETQLEALLTNLLGEGQFQSQARIYPGSNVAVDFAVKMPGRRRDTPVWLPIDSKFPVEDYYRLTDAQEAGDKDLIDQARKGLARAIREQAKSIEKKYILPPLTTDFAIMYLPSESLYAEVISVPGLFEELQTTFHVTPVGPTVVSALINSLQMGFVSFALQERSTEVWHLLGDVQKEFDAFGKGFESVRKRFAQAQESLDLVDRRQRVIEKKMSALRQKGDLTTPILEDSSTPDALPGEATPTPDVLPVAGVATSDESSAVTHS